MLATLPEELVFQVVALLPTLKDLCSVRSTSKVCTSLPQLLSCPN